ncbi:MAG: insulinase family protein [Clostridiales bacterium]|nr:insulinase family protein [Clostridiales bacterium]
MKIKKYPSGLRLVVNEKKDIDIVSFRIFINAGSANESENEYGIAHFLEHMFFKSTKKYSYQQLSTFFDELGTQKNAYTGVYKTCYYFKALGNVFEKSLELFAEMFFNNHYNEKEIAKEKNVILEEYQMGNDDTEKKCITNAYKALYNGTNLEHDVIGTKKTIKGFDSQDLLNFKNKWYVPKNMVISVSGNVTLKQVEKLLNKYFSSLFKGEYNGNYNLPPCVKVTPKTHFVSSFKDNEQSTIYILTDLGEKTNRQMYGFDLLFAILGFGMSSKFYNILRGEKALVYHVEADTSSVGKNNVAEIMFATSNENVCQALSQVLQILKDCSNGKVSNEELEKSKNKYIAGMVYSNETNGGISMRNGADLISDNKIESAKQIVADIRSVTLQEIINCAKEFYSQQNYVVSSVGKCKLTDLKCYKH